MHTWIRLGSALSTSRLDSLIKNINSKLEQDNVPIRVRDLVANFVYFVKFTNDLDSETEKSVLKKVETLLTNGAPTNELVELGPEIHTLIVVPRFGTISPWSSKATDICHTCGLEKEIERLERGIEYSFSLNIEDEKHDISKVLSIIKPLIHDRMTHVVCSKLPTVSEIYHIGSPKPVKTIDLISAATKTGDESPYSILAKANVQWGLALEKDEIEYLIDHFLHEDPEKRRNPTDVELMMFAQVNSEHCRHKIFGASWDIDGKRKDNSLFGMIKNTYKCNKEGILSAYTDNAAVLEGPESMIWASDSSKKNEYIRMVEKVPYIAKVETHNHPTAVSPFPGAATGSGGEIRDEGAVGQGSKPGFGLTGFTVSNLRIPGFVQPWETKDHGKASHLASALDIMTEAPLGGAAFNNEFGRPNLTGYFRTFLEEVPGANGELQLRGYNKPIMIAGGLGHVREQHVHKGKILPGDKLIVLGGPSMLVGLGGGSASSMNSGSATADLDFASVQRDNAEVERRCQQVIDYCTTLGNKTPIVAIHDVGAGGLSNALPEIVHDSGLGAIFQLRDIPCADKVMSAMEIWCNESQERYVLAVRPENVTLFEQLCNRERCPFGVVGVATLEERLILEDSETDDKPIDISMSTLFGKPPKKHKVATTISRPLKPLSLPNEIKLETVVDRILHLPAVASKSFLITIGDRCVTGLVSRDQMVGPWQVPVADVAVGFNSYEGYTGSAMAMGERPALALINPAASAKVAVVESLTNLISADVDKLNRVILSANWMSSADFEGEGSALYAAAEAIGLELCPELGITIPVGKDSMSMKSAFVDAEKKKKVITSPLSLVITAFSNVKDVRRTVTPELHKDIGEETVLALLDISMGKKRLGGSAIAQVFNQIGHESPNVDSIKQVKGFWNGLVEAKNNNLILAYHDKGDGGLFVTVAEMVFASRAQVELDLSAFGVKSNEIDASSGLIPSLFNEELGAVIQIRSSDIKKVEKIFKDNGFDLSGLTIFGKLVSNAESDIKITVGSDAIFAGKRSDLQSKWTETSYHIQKARDNAQCAQSEFEKIRDENDKGLHTELTFNIKSEYESLDSKALINNLIEDGPVVGIIREQGINSQGELSFAFHAAGFKVIDVHMTDIISGKVKLDQFHGLGFPGGFSYGDVLGAGKGWASSILYNDNTRKEFVKFFNRKDTFTIGICNGCQALSKLRDIIPGAESWPDFVRNNSEQFEARVALAEISKESKSIFLKDMEGSKIPIAVAHGEGRADFGSIDALNKFEEAGLVSIRYINSNGSIAQSQEYPQNPNGSPNGIAGVSSNDGRVLILMPHPERVIRSYANTWGINHKGRATGYQDSEFGAWFKIFLNARKWVKETSGI